MYQTKSGFCPTQQKEYSISIEYLPSSTLSSSQYIRGLADCDYRRESGCAQPNCPIYDDAPKIM